MFHFSQWIHPMLTQSGRQGTSIQICSNMLIETVVGRSIDRRLITRLISFDQSIGMMSSSIAKMSRKPETPPTITTTWTMRFSFVRFFRAFLRFFFRSKNFQKLNGSRRCDDFDPKIVKVRTILAIFPVV